MKGIILLLSEADRKDSGRHRVALLRLRWKYKGVGELALSTRGARDGREVFRRRGEVREV